MKKERIRTGIYYSLFYSLMFACGSLSVEMAGDYHHAVEIAFWRSLLVTAMLGIWFVIRNQKTELSEASWKNPFSMGAAGTVAMALNLFGFVLLP